MTCKAKQYSDQMACSCGNVWDMNDEYPPACQRTQHQDRVNAAREAMGSKYLCHRENRVSRLWRGPVRVKS